ncbi:type IV secretory system conjugative DNA transfer family protein [Brevundimonas naejangsanensis]|uniref:type IV secretory system conjugative DNA transfer family protein n=1 Tax=Brevundimonas naejangsanensis TaxID=588932 RepID=UPI003D0584DE
MSRSASAAPGPNAAKLAFGLFAAVLFMTAGGGTIALIGLGQFSGDVDPLRAPAWFWYYRDDPEVRRWLLIGFGSATLLTVLSAAAALLSRRRPLHGAARWATPSEQRAAGLRARQGLILGRAREGGFLITDGPEHVMLYAPTRTGKGVGVVIPNLLTWPHSVVVLDIKRENFEATAGYRAESGQRVLMFDPLASDGRTARFNPLGHVDRSDPLAVLDELQRMAAMLFPGHDHADPFWSEAARTGFIGVGAYVAATPDRPFTLGEIFRQLTAGDPRQRFPKAIETRLREGRPLPAGCVAALNDFCASSENTFASVRQTLTTRMGLWLNPRVDAATTASDFDLRDLRSGKMSLYLGASPDNLLRVAPLYSLLFQQLVDLNSRSLPAPSDKPTLVLLDEFARLGAAPVLAHAFAWVAGYGLRLLPVLQGPAQLRAIYGHDLAEDIFANCGVEVVFAPKDLKTAQDLSERLGAYTYAARSRSRPKGFGRGRRTVTVSDQRRPLMLPQELLQMPPTDLLVLKSGLPAICGRKIAYYREPVLRRRLRPAPQIDPTPPLPNDAPFPGPTPTQDDADMDLDAIIRAFAEEGLPPPAHGASEGQVRDWLDRVMAEPSPTPESDA